MERTLDYPFDEARVRSLRVGDRVHLSGTVFTGRDRLHKFLAEGGASPVCLKDGAMYHCGPVVLRRDGAWSVRAAGPTTSRREDAYMPRILRDHGLRVIIGKGGMGEETLRACRELGAVYLHAVGGAASVQAATIQAIRGVHFLEEFGPTEALWELDVAGMVCVVTMDTRGRSVHRAVRNSSLRALRSLQLPA